jgi:hypothetical protein
MSSMLSAVSMSLWVALWTRRPLDALTVAPTSTSSPPRPTLQAHFQSSSLPSVPTPALRAVWGCAVLWPCHFQALVCYLSFGFALCHQFVYNPKLYSKSVACVCFHRASPLRLLRVRREQDCAPGKGGFPGAEPSL